MPDPGHRDSWPSPAGGWPSFCRWCGKRLTGRRCTFCDTLYEQEDYKGESD